ncbi:hypothetical protein RYX36_028228, partial [Vicia faba]
NPIIMFCYSIHISLLYHNNLIFTNRSPILHLLLKPFSSSSSKTHAFTLNYLILNLGFSPQTTSKVSTEFLLHNSQNLDSVLAVFKTYGFSKSSLKSSFSIPIKPFSLNFISFS